MRRMWKVLFWCVGLFGARFLGAQDITLTNQAATFTNLEGAVFDRVKLVRADSDGVIWVDGASGGRVCYTNLHPTLLEQWGIPTNRIQIARERAGQKAAAETRARLQGRLQAIAVSEARLKARIQEAAALSEKERADQRRADAEAISALEAEIKEAKILLRRAEALARDYNRANRYNRLAPKIYVKDIQRAAVEEAEKRLKEMKASFARQYGSAAR